LGWGTIGEGNGDGEGKRMGGRGQFTSNLGPKWTGIAPHAKEGFQVSKRDSGTEEGSSGRRGIFKGIHPGVIRGLCHVLSCNVNPVHIVLLYECHANKRLCLGYK
jgi:hypothetical protein